MSRYDKVLCSVTFGLAWFIGLVLFFAPDFVGLGLEWSPVGAVILLGSLMLSFGFYVQGGRQ